MAESKYDIEQIKKENAALRKYAAIQKATEEKIGCQKIYVDIAGGIPEAFILDELIFFTLPRPETGKSGLRVWKDGVLWMAVSRSEWWDRKRLTAKEADGAITRLLNRNLIFKDHFLFNKQKTTHLRLNIPLFFKLYSEFLEKQDRPEDGSNTTQKDISDLYEMMGIPKEETPQMEEGIPVKDTPSLIGDSINSPHTALTQPDIDTPDAQVFRALENLMGLLPSGITRYVDTWLEKHPLEWIFKAIDIAKEKNAMSEKYIDRILIGWEANGYPKSRDEQVRERRNGKTPAPSYAPDPDRLAAAKQAAAQIDWSVH